jgi:uncharacterized cupin superfamily protein
MADRILEPAILASDLPSRAKPSVYPEPFFSQMRGREKRPLGDPFGLTNFGVNLTRLKPDGVTALRHAHTRQDELIYVLEGNPVLVTNDGKTPLAPGMCAGFKAGSGDAHQLLNPTEYDVLYIEIGDRTKGDEVTYPDDDLVAAQDANGDRIFTHKDGRPY